MPRKIMGRTAGARRKIIRATPPPPARLFMPHSFTGRVELINNSLPMVFIPREVYSRMWHIVDLAHQEVGWLGTVERTEHGNFLLKEVFLLAQEVGPAHTAISPESVAELGTELISTREDGVERANELLFWGHSHAQMCTSPSRQDDDQMEEFRKNGAPWFVRGIVNRLGRMEFTVYLWESGVKVVDAPWAVYDSVDGRMRQEIEAEFRAKVKKAPVPVFRRGRRRYRHDHIIPMGEMSVVGGVEETEEFP